MDNRRQSARFRTLKGAKAVFNEGSSVVDCVVRDLSDTGARLKVETSLGFPERFTLVLQADGTCRRCKSTWRTAQELA
jgi:hypothetical protein